MQRDVRGPVAALELLAGPAWTGIVAPRIRHLVELSQSFPRGTTGKPVGMDVPGRGSDQLDGDMGVSGLRNPQQVLRASPEPGSLTTLEAQRLIRDLGVSISSAPISSRSRRPSTPAG